MPSGAQSVCPKCGETFLSKLMVCPTCLNRKYLAELLEYEPERITGWIELGQSVPFAPLMQESQLMKKKAVDLSRHIALFGDREYAYCGKRLLHGNSKRSRVAAKDFPPTGVCRTCEDLYRAAARKAKEKMTS